MYFNNDSKIIYFSGNNITQKDIPNLFIPVEYKDLISHITKVRGEYYYFKRVNNRKLINELIGSSLAKRIDLNTVDYRIGKEGLNSEFLYAISKLFFERGFTYQSCYDFYDSTSKYQEMNYRSFLSNIYLCDFKMLEKIECYNTLLKVLKLTALDLKMGQFDRHEQNLFLMIDYKGYVDLAPIFDYGGSYSYIFGNEIYNNPFLMVRKNKLSLSYFAHKFPEIIEYASLLESIPIDDVLDDIEREHQIQFCDQERSSYQKIDRQYNKVLQKLIKL